MKLVILTGLLVSVFSLTAEGQFAPTQPNIKIRGPYRTLPSCAQSCEESISISKETNTCLMTTCSIAPCINVEVTTDSTGLKLTRTREIIGIVKTISSVPCPNDPELLGLDAFIRLESE